MEWNVWEAVIRIIVCLPIVGALAYLLIKYGLAKNYTRDRGTLKLLEQVVLSPKATINIVRAGNEYLLISATEQAVSVIGQLDNYQENHSSEFQFDLSKAMQRFSRGSESNV